MNHSELAKLSHRSSGHISAFNLRSEIRWFGFVASVEDDNVAVVRLSSVHEGTLGGGGKRALNGGVISAGFDAACVLASSIYFDAEVVATMTLNVQFLRLAEVVQDLRFIAWITKGGRRTCFAQAELVGTTSSGNTVFASAQATLVSIG